MGFKNQLRKAGTALTSGFDFPADGFEPICLFIKRKGIICREKTRENVNKRNPRRTSKKPPQNFVVEMKVVFTLGCMAAISNEF